MFRQNGATTTLRNQFEASGAAEAFSNFLSFVHPMGKMEDAFAHIASDSNC
jgi:hypothetical protein